MVKTSSADPQPRNHPQEPPPVLIRGVVRHGERGVVDRGLGVLVGQLGLVADDPQDDVRPARFVRDPPATRQTEDVAGRPVDRLPPAGSGRPVGAAIAARPARPESRAARAPHHVPELGRRAELGRQSLAGPDSRVLREDQRRGGRIGKAQPRRQVERDQPRRGAGVERAVALLSEDRGRDRGPLDVEPVEGREVAGVARVGRRRRSPGAVSDAQKSSQRELVHGLRHVVVASLPEWARRHARLPQRRASRQATAGGAITPQICRRRGPSA